LVTDSQMKNMKPTPLAKYGTLVSCGILVLTGLCSWFIKYPDIVSADAVLTGSHSPKPLVARKAARIAHLNYKDGDKITQGAIIGNLETTADIDEVLLLDIMTDSVYRCLQREDIFNVKAIMSREYNSLGELQQPYQALIQAYIPYLDYVSGNYAKLKRSLLEKDLAMAASSRKVLDEQQKLNQEDLMLSKTTLEKNKRLLEQRLISEEEYRNLNSQNINKQLSQPQLKSNYISNEAQANGIRKEMADLDNQVHTQKALFVQAVYSFKSQISLWKQDFLFIAPESGVLNFTSFLQANQMTGAGQVLGYIIPQQDAVYAEARIPQTNFGKIARGQSVLLKLDAYPWQEFGMLTGKVDYVSAIPADSGYYLARISIPEAFITNYQKRLPFKEGLMAHAEIVTRDMRLAQRFVYDFVKQFKK